MSINVLHIRSTTVNENDGLPLPKRYWAILATALGVGMSVIDGTIANGCSRQHVFYKALEPQLSQV